MTDHVEIRSGAYADSVALLQVSRDVQGVPGVVTAQVAMATTLNLEVLAQLGFTIPESTPNDMIVAIRFEDEAALAPALAAVEAALARKAPVSGGTAVAPHRSTATALRDAPDALVLVSVPGASAAVEAADAIEAGHDVMIFSDNVPVEQEIALKDLAAARDVLVMGPDCGTAVVDGLGLGFANAVVPGPIGIVAASGTGSQQVLALLDAAGVGVTHALGVGGRDLSAAVGGRSTKAALRRLADDPRIERIVVVSKPPDDAVAADIRAYADGLGVPVGFALLGAGQPDITTAVEGVLTDLGTPTPAWPVFGSTDGSGNRLHGMFVGGTLCDEAMLIAAAQLGPIASNIPLPGAPALGADLSADGHRMIDFGDDALTQGRAHPMIDPTLRNEQLDRIDDGVVLLDVVLGHGSEADPASGLGPVINTLRRREIPVVVALVGTRLDPQGLDRQRNALADAGAEVHLSNAGATRRALELLGA